jgi:hypothetical protein
MDWWVNFADPHLFVAFQGRLFAQDEIQVAEHPSLGHLKIKLVSIFSEFPLTIPKEDSGDVLPETRHGGQGTPILIRNIERRCSVAVDANKEEGRP